MADGLPLHGGAQQAIDTTLVSPPHRDGRAIRGAAEKNGEALKNARRRKERTYNELAGEGSRARLVVLGPEVGGRWSKETAEFLSAMAWAQVRKVGERGSDAGKGCWVAQPRRLLPCHS